MLARPGRLPDRHPPLPSGQSLNPATTSHHARLSFTGHQQGFTHVHPSGLPPARAPGVEPAALRLSPELRTPPSPATHVRGGDRPSSTDLELPLNSQPSISNPVVHPMRATSRRTANSRARTHPGRGTCICMVAVLTEIVTDVSEFVPDRQGACRRRCGRPTEDARHRGYSVGAGRGIAAASVSSSCRRLVSGGCRAFRLSAATV